MTTRRNQLESFAAIGAGTGLPGSHRTRSAFSLLEVMAALALLAVGVLATTAGQISAIKHSSDSRQATLAVYLAEQQMETFKAMDSADVLALMTAPGYPADPDNPIDPATADTAAMQFNRRWIIAPDTPEAGIITITIEVDWNSSLGAVRTARIQSLKVDT